MLILCILLLFACLIIIAYLFKKLKQKDKEITKLEFQNKALETSYDTVRTFKHDFFNIMQSINGYIKTQDISSLKQYYQELNLECKNINNLSSLNPEIIDDCGIYNLISSKYYESLKYGISFDMNFLIKLSSLNLKPYVISRILGILLDNAIDAAKESSEKAITFEIIPSLSGDVADIVIKNSYSNKNVDINKISEKGFTSKSEEARLSWAWALDNF